MTLMVIGSGFGCTGTMSTKLALEELGFGPCRHMLEVMQRPDQRHIGPPWQPHCSFLDVPVPDTRFPRSDPRDEFWAHFGGEPA
ncbi:hypothetical protein RA2_01765 [Roseovarius sp. A-2]|uniref:sulfotransferase n=1 Tax=Roseovarius sp. A-2 TaxID=1570360 RepID=UPI0009B53BCA|nr:sulfotransferase [Roseovarius sp. A-2]GAW34713.1 hypothetical protein RA2_01765 [Roseovarius sp. A-2]